MSVITGRAGTGKTTVAQALLRGIEKAEGRQSVLLLAPTGKARIRLQEATQRQPKTIHQYLAEMGWLTFPTFAFKREGAGLGGAHTGLIDEASMIPTDLMATLFRALDFALGVDQRARQLFGGQDGRQFFVGKLQGRCDAHVRLLVHSVTG